MRVIRRVSRDARRAGDMFALDGPLAKIRIGLAGVGDIGPGWRSTSSGLHRADTGKCLLPKEKRPGWTRAHLISSCRKATIRGSRKDAASGTC